MLDRIAIVDFDIHHGNGTEACVRALTPQLVTLPSVDSSVMQGTACAGVLQEQHQAAARQELRYKPWLDERDAECVFFASVHLYEYLTAPFISQAPVHVNHIPPKLFQSSITEANFSLMNTHPAPFVPGPASGDSFYPGSGKGPGAESHQVRVNLYTLRHLCVCCGSSKQWHVGNVGKQALCMF